MAKTSGSVRGVSIRNMEQYLEELRKYDSIYSKATVEELKKGEKISKTLKEFDNPEETLEEKELFLLSQYFAYTNIVDSKEDLEDEYEFDEEDRD